MTLTHKKIQETYCVLNKTVKNALVQEAAVLLGISVVANFCRSHLTIGDVITEWSSLVAKGGHWIPKQYSWG